MRFFIILFGTIIITFALTYYITGIVNANEDTKIESDDYYMVVWMSADCLNMTQQLNKFYRDGWQFEAILTSYADKIIVTKGHLLILLSRRQ